MNRARRGLLIAAGMLLACGAPPAGGAPGKQAPAPADAPGAQAKQAQRLITEVSALPRLSRPEVEKLLGVNFRPAPDADGDPTLLEAPLARGPFARVRLRVPGPEKAFGPSLSLHPRDDGQHLTRPAFEARHIGPVVDINPNIPPEGTVTHAFVPARPTTVVEFWGQSLRLRQVTIKRAPEPAASAR